MANLAGFRSYAVIGSEETDAELTLCLEAAKAYAKNAGVAEPEDDDALYDLLVYRLAMVWHDNRGFPEHGNDAPFVGCNGLILQLRNA